MASADFSPGGNLLAIGCLDGTVALIACESGQVQQRYQLGSSAVLSVAFAPDGQQVAAGSRAGECRILNVASPGSKTIRRHSGHQISSVRYSVDGQYLALAVNRRSTVARGRGFGRCYLSETGQLSRGSDRGRRFRPRILPATGLLSIRTETANCWSMRDESLSRLPTVSAAALRRLSFSPIHALGPRHLVGRQLSPSEMTRLWRSGLAIPVRPAITFGASQR